MDALVESALDEQAREQAAFMRVLQASRDALASARMELDSLRAYLEARDQEVVDLVDDRLLSAARQDTQQDMHASVEALIAEQAGLKRTLTVKLEAVAGSLEAVEWRTQEALSTLNDRVATLEGGVAALAQSHETRSQEVAGAILGAIEPVGRIMHLVQDRLSRAASDLSAAQGALFGLLIERDDRLEAQRDQILGDLLREFAGVVKPRDRQRAANALLEAEEHRKQRRDASSSRSAFSPGASYPGSQPPSLASPFSPAAAAIEQPPTAPAGYSPPAVPMPYSPTAGGPPHAVVFGPGLAPEMLQSGATRAAPEVAGSPATPPGPRGRAGRRGRPSI